MDAGPAPPVGHGVALNLLAALAAIGALHWARGFLVPVLTAYFLAHTLQPMVNRLHAWRVPRVIGALLVLGGVLASFAFTAAALSDDALLALDSLPSATSRFADTVERLHSHTGGTVRALERVSRELDRVVRRARQLSSGDDDAQPPVVVAAPSRVGELVLSGSVSALSALSTLALSLLLVFFLLQAGDTFRRKLVRVIGPRLSTKRVTVEVLNDISTQVQNYMFTLLVTNTVLALSGWAVYHALGLAHAAVWAIVAAVLHLVPYVGTLASALLVALAAFTDAGTIGAAVTAALATLALATASGVLLGTWMSGRQARMNPTAIFLSLLFFGWLWGAWGLLLGIPLAVTCKVVAERIDALQPFAELLSE
ncbi:MAG: AI-2E family transporter [Gammaproteobacteria bacterium]